MAPRSIALLLCGTLCACRLLPGGAVPPPYRPPPPIHLTVVETNDLHGWVEPHQAKLADGTAVEEGGVAVFGGYLRLLRGDNPGGVVLVDSGDLFQGTLVANLTEGAIVIGAMNELGYTAAALGNHEFDYGPVGPMPVASEPGANPFGALQARLAQAKFPLLAVNIYEASTGGRPRWLGNPGWVIVEVKGVKVGIFGLLTPATPQVTSPINLTTLRFGSLASEARHATSALRAQGAEIVIGLVHAGGKCESAANPQDISSCDTSGEIFEMLKTLDPGSVDLVVAGHTHSVLGHWVNGIPVIQSTGMGRTFGVIDLWVDPESRRALPEKTALRTNISVCEKVEASSQRCELAALKSLPAAQLVPATFLGRVVERDRQVDAVIAPGLQRVDALHSEKLGLVNAQPLTRKYEAESPLGSFLADALREMEGADIALLNSGGLRADLPAGEIRYGDFYEVIPFDNTVATIVLTGEELRRLLMAAYGARKGVFQQSGLKLVVSQCPEVMRLKSIALADGRPLEKERRYRVVMPDFLARGGDGLSPAVIALPPGRIDFGEARPLNFRDAIVAHLRQRKGPLMAPKPGRTQMLDDAARCPPASAIDLHTLNP